jgi:putative transposase
MKKTRFTEAQIVNILKQQEGGRTAKELALENAVLEATIYNWKSKYCGMESSDVRRLKDLEEENSSLKKMYADVAMDNQILKDLFSKKGWALSQKGS